MEDKSLSVFLTVLFGVAGVVVLALVWLRPVPESDRVLTAIVGSVGLIIALVRAFRLKSKQTRTSTEQVTVEVDAEDR